MAMNFQEVCRELEKWAGKPLKPIILEERRAFYPRQISKVRSLRGIPVCGRPCWIGTAPKPSWNM